eukprot:scaffold87056_cov30-Phaeocystis_antarctica.AAC.1
MGSRRPSNAVPGWRVPTPRQFIRRSAKLSVQKRSKTGRNSQSGRKTHSEPVSIGSSLEFLAVCAAAVVAR